MTSLLRSISRVLRIGKQRYLAGYDLHNNAYYEFPSRSGSSDPRHTRRTIVWKEKKDFSEYDQSSLPVQWKMWLRHTRRSPPTIQELQEDLQRIRLTQYNASILAAKEEERQRLSHSQSNHQPQLSSPSSSPSPSASASDDVWAASKARIQSQDSQAQASGVNPQPNISNSSSSSSTPSSFADQFGLGRGRKADEPSEPNSEFSQALNRRSQIRREREQQDELERRETERKKWLLKRSVLEDFDPGLNLSHPNPNPNPTAATAAAAAALEGSSSGSGQAGFREETKRQAQVVEKVGNQRGLGAREGKPGTPSGEFTPKEWSPGVAKRGG